MDQRGLVEQAQRGDHDAFAVLTRAAIARLDAAARLILRDRELARDAVQDTLLYAWRNLPGLRDPERTLPDDGLHAPRANRGPAGACVRSAADSLTFAPYPDRTTSVSP